MQGLLELAKRPIGARGGAPFSSQAMEKALAAIYLICSYSMGRKELMSQGLKKVLERRSSSTDPIILKNVARIQVRHLETQNWQTQVSMHLKFVMSLPFQLGLPILMNIHFMAEKPAKASCVECNAFPDCDNSFSAAQDQQRMTPIANDQDVDIKLHQSDALDSMQHAGTRNALSELVLPQFFVEYPSSLVLLQ